MGSVSTLPETANLASRHCQSDLFGCRCSLSEKQTANRAEIVEDAPALVHVAGQLVHLEQSEPQGLGPPLVLARIGLLQVLADIGHGLLDPVLQQKDEFVGALDRFEWPDLLRAHGSLGSSRKRVRGRGPPAMYAPGVR